MSGATYTCEACGGTFEKTRSEAEVMAEARSIFSPAELAEPATVCDDCWKAIEPHLPRLRAELDQEAAAAGLSADEFLRREARRKV